jgi:hypothetical protein
MSEEREKHVIVKMHPDPDEYIEAETAFLSAHPGSLDS